MVFASLAFAAVLQAPSFDSERAWSTIRSSIEGRYYARSSQHERMETLLNKYEPQAKEAKTQSEFEQSVNSMISDFGDSHFGFFTKSDQGFYMMQSLTRANGEEMPNIGAWFNHRPGGYEIQMLINGGAAEKAGLRKGDLVTKVNDNPFTPVDSLRNLVDRKS